MNQETTQHDTDDLRIKELKELNSPASLIAELPVSEEIAKTVHDARAGIHNILHGKDDRLVCATSTSLACRQVPSFSI